MLGVRHVRIYAIFPEIIITSQELCHIDVQFISMLHLWGCLIRDKAEAPFSLKSLFLTWFRHSDVYHPSSVHQATKMYSPHFIGQHIWRYRPSIVNFLTVFTTYSASSHIRETYRIIDVITLSTTLFLNVFDKTTFSMILVSASWVTDAFLLTNSTWFLKFIPPPIIESPTIIFIINSAWQRSWVLERKKSNWINFWGYLCANIFLIVP